MSEGDAKLSSSLYSFREALNFNLLYFIFFLHPTTGLACLLDFFNITSDRIQSFSFLIYLFTL